MTADNIVSGAVNVMGKILRQSFLTTVSGTESRVQNIAFHSHNAQVSRDEFVQRGELSILSEFFYQNLCPFFKFVGSKVRSVCLRAERL